MSGQPILRDMLAEFDWRRLAGPLDRATDALARLDERLRTSALADGWRARIDYHDSCAAIWAEGELASLEDVVLREAGMDVRLASDATNRALAVLRTRRRLSGLAPGRVLAWDELSALSGGRAEPGGEDRIWLEDAEGEGERLRGLLALLSDLDALPPLLGAAAFLEIWTCAGLAARRPSLGPLAAAVVLRRAGRTKRHLPAFALGLKEGRLRLARARSLQERIETALAAFEAGALAGGRELDRLAVAAERIELKGRGRRADSRLPDLGRLLLDLPLVSAPLAARRLKVSQQAVQKLMAELEGVAREVTGRGRYRAWAIL